MHNGLDIGSVFPGPLQDPAALASADQNATRKTQSRAPLSASEYASEFRSVFDAAEATPFVPDGPREANTDLEGIRRNSGLGANPEDEVFDLADFFKAIASGEIELDGLVSVGSVMKDQISSMAAYWSGHGGADPGLTSQTSGPNAMSPGEIIESLQAVAAALPAGSEAQKAVLALESLAVQVQKTVADAQQMTPSPTHAGALSSVLPAGTTMGEKPQALATMTGAPGIGVTGLGDGGALAQTQGAVAPTALSSEIVAEGSTAPGLATAKGAATPYDPLVRSTGAALADKSASGLSALLKDTDDRGRLEAIKPALTAVSSPYGGPEVYAPRSLPAWSGPSSSGPSWSGPVSAMSGSAAQFDTVPSEPFAMDAMLADPAVETAAREARAPNVAVFGSQMPAGQMSQAQPQQIARQIAIAIQNNTSGRFEISLSPAELGTVRISLTTADTGMIVNIQAERSETLDLIRRNTDILAEDFRDLGFDATSFSFEGSDGQHDSSGAQAAVIHHRTDEQLDPGIPVDPNAPPDPPLILNDGSVDIRI